MMNIFNVQKIKEVSLLFVKICSSDREFWKHIPHETPSLISEIVQRTIWKF